MSEPELSVRFGIDRLSHGHWKPSRDARLALLMNQASVSAECEFAHQVVASRCSGQLKAIFTPQHGLWGEAQANMIESPHGFDNQLNVPVFSLYSETRRPSNEMLANIDELLIDLQDVGTRVYTFVWTVLECLKACRDQGVRVTVLDRPNPIGGTCVEGPVLDDAFRSFVGGAAVPMRHGLTIGELTKWLNERLAVGANLTVVEMEHWSRDAGFPEDRVWIPPSPNLPTIESCFVYPGQVLLEGTNLSEGRGTTRPFQVCGAPFIDSEEMCSRIDAAGLPGIRFLPTRFTPSFDKWAGESCGGVSLLVVDRQSLRPYQTTVNLLACVMSQHAEHFRWLEPPYEYEQHLAPIDIISGSDRLRQALNAAATHDAIAQATHLDHEAWRRETADFRLYESD